MGKTRAFRCRRRRRVNESHRQTQPHTEAARINIDGIRIGAKRKKGFKGRNSPRSLSSCAYITDAHILRPYLYTHTHTHITCVDFA